MSALGIEPRGVETAWEALNQQGKYSDKTNLVKLIILAGDIITSNDLSFYLRHVFKNNVILF